MATILSLLRRAEALDTENVSVEALDAVSDQMADLQREQLSKGQTSTGTPMEDTPGGRYKWESYADEKYRMNSRAGYGNPDLRYTGAFYNAITANVVGGSVIIESTDSKAGKLEGQYGADNIFGLNAQSKIELMKSLRPEFMQRIKTALYG